MDCSKQVTFETKRIWGRPALPVYNTQHARRGVEFIKLTRRGEHACVWCRRRRDLPHVVATPTRRRQVHFLLIEWWWGKRDLTSTTRIMRHGKQLSCKFIKFSSKQKKERKKERRNTWTIKQYCGQINCTFHTYNNWIISFVFFFCFSQPTTTKSESTILCTPHVESFAKFHINIMTYVLLLDAWIRPLATSYH